MSHLLPRIGGFRNGPEQGGTGVNVRRGSFVFEDPVQFNVGVDYSVAPTVDGRPTTREFGAVSPAGVGDTDANSFGSVILAGQLVSDERITGYDFPVAGLVAGLTFEGFRIINGTDIEFVWQNDTNAGLTIPQLIWNIIITRV